MRSDSVLRFLVVEDSSVSNQLISNQLERLGHRVVGQAFNGPEGVNQTERLSPDVVLMDLQMVNPETGREDPRAGIQAARAIQRRSPTPVVVLTAHEAAELVEEATAAGIGAYLLKPPDPQEIERAARIAIARFEDMQAYRHLNQKLREKEALLDDSQAIAHVGSWELDLATHQLTWSDEVYRIFGLRPQEFEATYEAFLDAVHPDDRVAVDDAYSGSLEEGQDSYEIEHRIVRPDSGEVRIVHEKCRHVRDAQGEVVRSVGMVQDITERKQAEKKIIQAKEEWAMTFDAVPDLIAILNEQYRIVRVNKAMAHRGASQSAGADLPQPDEQRGARNGAEGRRAARFPEGVRDHHGCFRG